MEMWFIIIIIIISVAYPGWTGRAKVGRDEMIVSSIINTLKFIIGPCLCAYVPVYLALIVHDTNTPVIEFLRTSLALVSGENPNFSLLKNIKHLIYIYIQTHSYVTKP